MLFKQKEHVIVGRKSIEGIVLVSGALSINLIHSQLSIT